MSLQSGGSRSSCAAHESASVARATSLATGAASELTSSRRPRMRSRSRRWRRRRSASGPGPAPPREAKKRSSRGALRYGCAGPISAAARSHRAASSTVSRSRASPQRSGSPPTISFHWSTRATGKTYTARLVAKVEKKGSLPDDKLRDFLREMLLIRRFEEKVEERFRAGELPGFLHVAIGQEAVAVGVCSAMEDGDIFASTHRAHGHTLASGTHPNAVMAELYGKIEGCSHGYGGSMHLYDLERGNVGANAVIGGGLPGLVGAGLAYKLRDEPRVSVAFFGDGATNIGTFHESLNLAQLWKTKTIFVCENNRWAESTPGWQHSPVWDDMSKRALAYDMRSVKVDGRDVEDVHEKASESLAHARSGEGPVFLDVDVWRMHGHYIGDPQVYRTKEDIRDAAEHHDPITLLRERLRVSHHPFPGLRQGGAEGGEGPPPVA